MEEYLQYVTPLLGIFVFIFVVFKYFHAQNLSEKNRRFENYQKIFTLVAGRTNEGTLLTDVHQAMGIYQLSEFPEYAYMSIPIIEYYIKTIERDDTVFERALLETKRRLSSRAD